MTRLLKFLNTKKVSLQRDMMENFQESPILQIVMDDFNKIKLSQINSRKQQRSKRVKFLQIQDK